MYIERSDMGTIAKLISEINDGYDNLEEYYRGYNDYAGGQPDYTLLSFYQDSMEEIKVLEDKLKERLKNVR